MLNWVNTVIAGIAIAVLAAPVASQVAGDRNKLSAGEVSCAALAFKRGVAGTVNGATIGLGSCSPPLGKIFVINSGEPMIKDGVTALAEWEQFGCNYILYPGSFDPEHLGNPSSLSLALGVSDFCSAGASAVLFLVGAHEAAHSLCPDVTAPSDEEDDCEEIAAQVKAAAELCEELDGAQSCCSGGGGCSEFLENHPELAMAGPGGGVVADPQKVAEFKASGCAVLSGLQDTFNEGPGLSEAFKCACGEYNDGADADCKFTSPPDGGCDGTPPGSSSAVPWPIPNCGSCTTPC